VTGQEATHFRRDAADISAAQAWGPQMTAWTRPLVPHEATEAGIQGREISAKDFAGWGLGRGGLGGGSDGPGGAELERL
jgi:hypothetical protein